MALTGQPEQMDDAVIANDDFFPDLALIDFLEPYQVVNSYGNTHLIYAVIVSIVKVNLRLQPFKAEKIAEGFASLNAYVTAYPEQVGNDDLLTWLYKKAVFCTAKAWVLVEANGGVAKHVDDSASLKDLNATVQFWLAEADGAAYAFLSKFGLQAVPVLTDKKLHARLL